MSLKLRVGRERHKVDFSRSQPCASKLAPRPQSCDVTPSIELLQQRLEDLQIMLSNKDKEIMFWKNKVSELEMLLAQKGESSPAQELTTDSTSPKTRETAQATEAQRRLNQLKNFAPVSERTKDKLLKRKSVRLCDSIGTTISSITDSHMIKLSPSSVFHMENEHGTKSLTISVEFQTWYKDYFYNNFHRNFIGINTVIGTVIISFLKEGDLYRVLVRSQDGTQNVILPSSSVEISGWMPSAHKLISSVNPILLTTGETQEIQDPKFPDALLRLETVEQPRTFKFGLLLVCEGQTTEDEILSNGNKDGSQNWKTFLQMLGDLVELKGFEKFRGGLDVKENITGQLSVFKEWRGNQIMWHVATYLPNDTVNEQQIAKKRHIGNDITLVVFLDGPSACFNPASIASQMIHVVICVQPFFSETHELQWKIAVTSREGVPLFGPTLPIPAIFSSAELVDFLYAKAINADLASLRTVEFMKRLRKGRNLFFGDMVSSFFPQEEQRTEISTISRRKRTGSNDNLQTLKQISLERKNSGNLSSQLPNKNKIKM